MKLSDIDVEDLVHALGMERSAWINAARDERRQPTEAERITICILSALEHAIRAAAERTG